MVDATETTETNSFHKDPLMSPSVSQDEATLPKKRDTEQQGSLVDDLLQVQEVIQQHKTELAGVPEALRSEAQHLREELSQMELFTRLGELKAQLCEAAGSMPDDLTTKQDSDEGMQTGEKEQGVSRQARTALVYEAEDKELDIQLNHLCQAVQDAKQSKMDLETRKMRLQKEMLELQLLMNAEEGTASDGNLDDECSEQDDDSPRIPAVNHFQIKELCNSEDEVKYES